MVASTESGIKSLVCYRSVKALWGYLKEEGVNTDKIWDLMKDIIIKTIIRSDVTTRDVYTPCRLLTFA